MKGKEAFTASNPVCNKEKGLSQCVHYSEEKLLQCVVDEGVMKQWDGKTSEAMKREKRERQHRRQQKALHRHFLRHTEGKRTKKTCMRLQRGDMKRETEAILIAAENRVIATNAVKVKIHEQQGLPLCRMCK